MSWEVLEDIGETADVREATQKREDTDRLVARVFCTDDGIQLLNCLKDVYVNVPIAVPGTDPSFAFYAEGCRNVIRDIEARIHRARKP